MTLIAASTSRPVINLGGTEGNAFALMGQFRQTAKQLGRSEDYIKSVIEDMMSGDSYKHLVLVFERELGQFFDIIVPEPIEASLMEDEDTCHE